MPRRMPYLGFALLIIVLCLSTAISSLDAVTLAQDRSECTVVVSPDEALQSAIDEAENGDVICLEAGTWETNLLIEQSLTLRGAGIGESTVRGAAYAKPGISIASDSKMKVAIKTLTVAEANYGMGIAVKGRSNLIFTDSAVVGNDTGGILMSHSAQATITNANIEWNGHDGLQIWDSTQVTLTDSIVQGNGLGIMIRDFAEVTLTNNFIKNQGFGVMLEEQPCEDPISPFQGYVTGQANTIGDVCPSPELDFLTTEEGGELDRRE